MPKLAVIFGFNTSSLLRHKEKQATTKYLCLLA